MKPNRTHARQLRQLAMGRAKGHLRRAVEADWPTSWLDSYLTGPEAIIDKLPATGPDIERLLDAMKRRVLAVIDRTEMR